MSNSEYTPTPKRPDPAKEKAVDPENVPGGDKSVGQPDKDPDNVPKTDIPRDNSQLHNTAKFNSEVSPNDYPKGEREASQLTGKPKSK